MRRRLQRRDERGAVAVLVGMLLASGTIMAFAAFGVDTARWYVEIQRVQKAADAAALGGVPYLPQDMTSAVIRAKAVAKRNGYDDDAPGVTVTVTRGTYNSQLRVTIESRIHNSIGASIGVNNATIVESAVADYQAPAPMGSPCNTFGNEPPSGTGPHALGPQDTALGASPFANCSSTPQFWANIEGPQTGKIQGDRYQTRGCEQSGVDGCTGTTNAEYDEFGYVFVVKVQPEAVNTNIDLQLYDPMFVNTGPDCALLPSKSEYGNNQGIVNHWVRNQDARDRYTRDGPEQIRYCTGDSFPASTNAFLPTTPTPMWTSFVLRQQTDTRDPQLALVQQSTAGSACIKQYGGASTSRANQSAGWPRITDSVFDENVSGYNEQIAETFHNWSSFCTFRPTRSGDYYLQVRSNVGPGGVGSGYLRSGNTAAAELIGNLPTGYGSNAFAIRAVTAPNKETAVAVSGYDRMPISVNADSATSTFNLVRVLPGSRGQSIRFTYFDAGDAQSSGSVEVIRPSDATGSITTTPFPGGCNTYGGSASGTETSPTVLTNCKAPIQQATSTTSKNNGKAQTIDIPIPADYNCVDTSLGGCWYRVRVSFGSGDVHDVTTWNASINGDPVRLIE